MSGDPGSGNFSTTCCTLDSVKAEGDWGSGVIDFGDWSSSSDAGLGESLFDQRGMAKDLEVGEP